MSRKDDNMYIVYLNPSNVIVTYNRLVSELNPPSVPVFSMDSLWTVYECAAELLAGTQIYPEDYEFFRTYLQGDYPTDIASGKWMALVSEASLMLIAYIAPAYRMISPKEVRHQKGVYQLYWDPIKIE